MNSNIIDKEALNKLQQSLDLYIKKLDANPSMSMSELLPILFRLKGKPLSLDWSHFVFEPMFKFRNVARRRLWKTSRQVAKSTNAAADQILLARLVNYINIMTVLPLQEQVRKFSVNYVRPLMMDSILNKSLAKKHNSNDSVLQRDLSNGSKLFYGYISGSADRLRGIASDCLFLDECQDADTTDLPIIEANLSASPYQLITLTGTPKTFDNTIEQFWEESSQAIWQIPCMGTGCKHINNCTVTGDLLNMLDEKTLVCAKCKQPVNSRLGYFLHRYPERQLTFAGYHVSQPIMPMHYESPNKWAVIIDAFKNKPSYVFYNEWLGESFDSGQKLMTPEILQAAGRIEGADSKHFQRDGYIVSVVGVDWGGRSREKVTDSEDFVSHTAVALGGMRTDGIVEITHVYRIPYAVDSDQEPRMVADTCVQAKVDWCAMDYGGQGNVLESNVKACGWPERRIVPFTYSVMAPTKPIVFYNPPAKGGVRSSYTLDKPRSLLLLCELIKRGLVLLPKYSEYKSCLDDFLSIYEESVDSARGSPVRLVKRLSRRHDDVAHAINFAVMAMYHNTRQWPKIAEMFHNKDYD